MLEGPPADVGRPLRFGRELARAEGAEGLAAVGVAGATSTTGCVESADANGETNDSAEPPNGGGEDCCSSIVAMGDRLDGSRLSCSPAELEVSGTMLPRGPIRISPAETYARRPTRGLGWSSEASRQAGSAERVTQTNERSRLRLMSHARFRHARCSPAQSAIALLQRHRMIARHRQHDPTTSFDFHACLARRSPRDAAIRGSVTLAAESRCTAIETQAGTHEDEWSRRSHCKRARRRMSLNERETERKISERDQTGYCGVRQPIASHAQPRSRPCRP